MLGQGASSITRLINHSSRRLRRGLTQALAAINMTATKHRARIDLQQASSTLLVEVISGAWSHVPNLNAKPIEQWVEVLATLEDRCPGHTKDDYVAALLRANRDNR